MSNEVREILQRNVRNWIPGSTVGQVTAVDGTDTCTVEPVDGGATLYKVRLRSTIDGNDEGVVSIPSVDSYVIVSPIDHNENKLFVSRFSNVESWHVKTENSTSIELKDDGTTEIKGDGSTITLNNDGTVNLNGSNFGSLIKINEIVDRLNAIEDAVSQLVNDFNVHTHPYTDTPIGAATTSVTTGISSANAGTTTVAAIENDKVQHGG